MNLTYRERANLAHVLFMFPILYLSIYPEILKGVDPETIKMAGVVLILLGSIYHTYHFLHVSKYI